MEINKKADEIISTDLLSNEVICIHTDGSVDAVVSNDNDEVGNVEHGVETAVQNDESPKVFSFEECKAAAEQCEDVGEFILKFTDEYDCAYQNDWLKNFFENPAAPYGFWTEQTIVYVARRCKTKIEFRNRYKGAYKRVRELRMLDTFDWFIPACGYYTKEMVFEISHKYTRINDWTNNKEDSRFYRYAKDNGWVDEMTWIKRNSALLNEWNDYEKCLAASKECKHKTEFRKKYRTAYRYSKENGWLDDFFPIEKKVERVYEIRAYEYELNGHKEVHIYHYFEGMNYRATLQFKNYRVANNLDIDLNSYKILATGLTKNNKSKFFIEFINQYENNGWNIAIKPYYVQKEYKDKHWQFDKNEIIRKAKTCKTLNEFKTKYHYDYTLVDVNVLREICPWLYEKTISYTIDELKEIISKYDSRSDLSKNNRHIYNYLKNNNLLDELLPSKVKNEEYWLGRKDEIIELSKQFKSVKRFKDAYLSEYNASKKYGFYNELQIQHEKKLPGYWRNYDNIRNEALKYDLYRDFSRGCPIGCKYAKQIGWLDDFYWLQKQYTVDLNKHEYWVYAYIDEENKYVYVGLTKNKNRHYNHNTQKKDNGEYVSAAKRYFESVNKPFPKPIMLKDGLNAEEAQYYEDYFVKKYESEGWNILNTGPIGIGKGSLGGGFNKWNDENVIKVAKMCKTLREFRRNHQGAYKYAYENGLLESFEWLNYYRNKRFYKNWNEQQFIDYFNKFDSYKTCCNNENSYRAFNFARKRFELKGVVWFHRRKPFKPYK